MRRKHRRHPLRSRRAMQVESMEARVLLAGDVVKINFQLGTTIDEVTYPELAGYLADDGSAYGDRGNGHTYGWLDGGLLPDTQNEARDRNNAGSPDERYDTLNHMIKGDRHSWRIALPNGVYHVYVVAGDPSFTDHVNNLELTSGGNLVSLIDPDGGDNWDEYTIPEFTVANGTLQLTPIGSQSNQKIAFIEITSLSAPKAPGIAVGTAADITGTSARLIGEVTDNGNEDPAVTLFYGTTDGGTNPDNWTTSVELGTQGSQFETSVVGLMNNTTYYYRYRATNSGGTTWSTASGSFLTRQFSAASLVTDPASNVTASSARVAGRVTDVGAAVPSVSVMWGKTDGGTSLFSWTNSKVLGPTAGEFAVDLDSLEPNTTYYYRALSNNIAGVSWSPVTRSFTTGVVSSPAVALESAIDIEAFSATMRGLVTNTGNQPPNITMYWGTTNGGSNPNAWQHQADIGAQDGSFAWTAGQLTHGTQYFYRALAQNSAGSVWTSQTLTFETLTVTPAAIEHDPPSTITSTGAKLGGRITDIGNHAPLVRIYYGTTNGGTNPAAWQNFVEFAEEFGSFATNVTGLLPETQYYFRAEAVNAAGSTWASGSDTFTTADSPVVVINEFMASNGVTLTTRTRTSPGGAWGAPMMPDWIELHNPSAQVISLAGLHLTDDTADRTKWTFPADAQIPAGGYLVVFASGENIVNRALDEQGFYHTNFKLSIEGEALAVTAADGTIIHQVEGGYPVQRTDISYGVDATGKGSYFATATPGASNVAGELNFVADTTFSVDRGFFTEPFSVDIRSKTPGATIVYTVDGSEPSLTNGTQVTAANDNVPPVATISISSTTNLRAAAFKTGFEPTNIDTQTYLFLNDVLKQSESFGKDGSGLPSFTRWGHSNKNGDWEVDPEIVNHANPENRLTTDDLRAVPTLSLVLPWENMFVTRTGIYISGTGSPRAVSVEQILGDGTTGFQINGSVQIQGGSSTDRWKADKLSMRLKFTEEYGPTKLNNPFFGPDGTSSIDTLVLDAVLNFGFHHPSTSQTDFAKFIQDQFVANLQNGMGGTAPHARYHHLYINGLYWGMYYVHERPDASFAAEYLGGEKEDYDVLKHTAGTVVDGTRTEYTNMLALARRDLAVDTNYQALAEKLDIDDFIDYMLVNLYTGNTDWAHHNWYASYNKVDPAGKWRFHSWDAEHVLKSLSEDVSEKNDSGSPTEIHRRLRSNAEYRLKFADHVQKHLFNDGILTPANAAAEYQKLMDEIDRAVVGETARWGDNRVTSPYTHADWLRTQNNLLNNYFPGRTGRVLSQLRTDQLYPSTSASAPEFHVNGSPLHGGYLKAGDRLTIAASGGTVYYTADGSDPRLPGGSVSPTALIASGDLLFDEHLLLNARLLNTGGEWSALSQAEFYNNSAASAGSLAITEINYNPHESLQQFGEAIVDSDDFEFLEFTNVSNQTIELANVRLARTVVGSGLDGVSYTFGQKSLAPGERIVVVANRAAFESRYGSGLSIAGEYDGRLNDGGELLTLLDASGAVIQQFEYNDSGAWPGRADGRGSSLEVVDTAGDYNLADNWRNSAEFGGSPTTLGVGSADDVVINEVLTHTDLPLVDMIELKNVSGAAIDVANWYLADSLDDLFAYRISGNNTVMASDGYLVFDEDQLGFGLKGQESDDVWLVAGDATGRPIRFVDHVEFGATQNGVSLGRWPDGGGGLFPMTSRTFGQQNSGPLLGGMLISEIHYHPTAPPPGAGIAQEQLEFIEVWNTSSAAIDVSHWRLNRAIDFKFAAGTVLGANQGLVIVSFDPSANPALAAAFRSVHGMAADRTLLGPYKGVLDNGGETVELDRPEDVQQLGLGYVLVDRVKYDDMAPWPGAADGQGASLQRKAANAYGDFTTSWNAIAPTPGQASFGGVQPILGDINGDGLLDVVDVDSLSALIRGGSPAGDLNGDSDTNFDDLLYMIHEVFHTSIGDTNLDGVFNSTDMILVFLAGEYEDGIDGNSTWAEGDWNGDGDFTSRDMIAAFLDGGYSTAAVAEPDANADVGAAVANIESQRRVVDPESVTPTESAVAPTARPSVDAIDAVYSLDDDEFGRFDSTVIGDAVDADDEEAIVA